MRVVAICAIVAFLAWASEQALAPPTIADRNLRPAVYAVEAPEPTTTAVPTPTGDVPQSASTAPAASRVDGPAVVVAIDAIAQGVPDDPTNAAADALVASISGGEISGGTVGEGTPAVAVVVATPDRGIAIQVTPTVPPPVPLLVIPHYDQWVALARCESGGNWSINTGNGYYGGLQFALTSWRGAGGEQYAAYPHMASAAQQMSIAETLLDMQGWGAWPTCSRKVGLR